MNKLYEDYNVMNIKKTIDNEIEEMIEEHNFKDIKNYLINMVSNSDNLFFDVGLRFNRENKNYKKEELYRKINLVFPRETVELKEKCKYEVNLKYIKILQNIVDESNIIHEKIWLQFNCYICNYINNISSTICDECGCNINYNEYIDKYNKMLIFGVRYREYMEQYNMTMELKDLIRNRQLYVNSCFDIANRQGPSITIEMGELYSNIENLQFDKYYSLNKSKHLDLYEKWKVYNCFYLYKEHTNYNNIIEETTENNRFSSYDKYNEEYEIWFSKRNYYYHIYILDRILFKDTCEMGIIKNILSYSHPSLELYCNDDIKNYDNDFYKWYLTLV